MEQTIGLLDKRIDSLKARMDYMHSDLSQNFEQLMDHMRGNKERGKFISRPKR